MGSLILCHKKRAKRPFEISRVHMRIYTIEELCYYICNNLYLIDYTIVNERLCRWVGDELELPKAGRGIKKASSGEWIDGRICTYDPEGI